MKGTKYMKWKLIIILFIVFLILMVNVNAKIPVTYMCCLDYTNNNGTQIDSFDREDIGDGIQLDNFENISNWTSTQGTQQADPVNHIDGNQGLKLFATNGNRAATDKVINNNFSTTKNFVLWIYVTNVSSFDCPAIYFTSDNTWNKYFILQYYDSPFSAGWNKLVIDKSTFVSVNGESWNNVMKKIRIAIYPIDQNTNVTLDNLRYDKPGNWTVGGVGSSLQADKIHFKEGMQGLKLIAKNGNSAFIDSAISTNFSKTNNFVIWTYVENASNITYLRFYFTSTTDWTKYFHNTIDYGLETGWNKLVFNKNNFKNEAGESWNNMMTMMRLRIGTMNDANITFDDLRTNMTGKRAKLMIQFDDGLSSVYSNAYPILKANNQSATSFMLPYYIESPPDYMNLSNFRTLQNAGWDISSHTIDHAQDLGLPYLDDFNQSSELNDSYDWLISHNFQKSAGFISYPYGYFNGPVLDKVKKRYTLGRAVQEGSAQQHFIADDDSIRYIQRVTEIHDDTTVQSVKDNINDTINSKLLGILLFHDIVTNPSDLYTYSYLTSNLTQISAYIKSRSADIDVITYSDYVIPNINKFTPVINKTTTIYSNGSSVLITNNKYDEYMPNMTVVPSNGSVDITITTYNETNGSIKFNESSNSSLQNYTIGDRKPNQLYSIKIYWANGTKYQDFNLLSNSTGYINYSSTGFGPRYQEIKDLGMIDTTFTITLPVGYTFLRFNASNSTVNNLNPDGQNSSRPMFNITNNGNINQSFMLSLSGIVNNITTYADLSNNFSTGKIEINTSNTIIIPNLIPGSSQNVWMIIDVNKAPPANVNKTFMINSV